MFDRHRGLASLRPITSPALQATPGIKQGLYRIDHHSRRARRGHIYLELAKGPPGPGGWDHEFYGDRIRSERLGMTCW